MIISKSPETSNESKIVDMKMTTMVHMLLVSIVLLAPMASAESSKIPPPKGDQCVEETEWMRVHHFETILHQRDETVKKGIRTTKHSLKNCINCHITANAAGEYARYSNKEQHFCASCHEFTAVTIDCFHCHSDRPEQAVRDSIEKYKKDGKHPRHEAHNSASDLILNSKLLTAQ